MIYMRHGVMTNYMKLYYRNMFWNMDTHAVTEMILRISIISHHRFIHCLVLRSSQWTCPPISCSYIVCVWHVLTHLTHISPYSAKMCRILKHFEAKKNHLSRLPLISMVHLSGHQAFSQAFRQLHFRAGRWHLALGVDVVQRAAMFHEPKLSGWWLTYYIPLWNILVDYS